jgi:protein-S-isoprenylcysteine O-methyltransferase Ste14
MEGKNGEHPFGDAGQLLLFIFFLAVWVADSFFLHESIFLSNYVPTFVRLLASALTFVAAIFLVKAGHVVLENEKRPPSVVSDGAFKHIRHPLYLGSILIFLTFAISTLSLASLGIVLVVFVFYDYLASYEEKLLEAKFGEEYKMYEQRTGKWLPKIGKLRG